MKKIEAIIRKSIFEDIKEVLLAADIERFSYYGSEARGKSALSCMNNVSYEYVTNLKI